MSLFKKLITKSYIWATEQLYHTFAWAYDFVAWLVSFGSWSKWRKDALRYLQPGKILEIGFGTGALLIEMTRQGSDVYGLEPSFQMLRVTKRKTTREGISLRIIQAKAQRIPFPDGTFENIVSTFPSDYIIDEDTLKEIRRVLDVGGRVVFTGFGVHYKSGFKNWLTGWFLSNGSDFFIKRFCQNAQEMGFKPNLIQHRGKSYTLPIIIMENEHGS